MNNKLHEIDIQPTDRVAFIHIPKTAGITFSAVIDPLLSGLPRCPEILPENFVQLEYEEIIKYRLFMGHFSYQLLKMVFPSGFLTLTFLREPVGRTVSHFKYLQRQEKLGGPALGDFELQRIKNMTLDEFVVNTELHTALDIVNIQTRLLGEFNPKKYGMMWDKRQCNTKNLISNKLMAISYELNVEIPSVKDLWFANWSHLEIAKRRLAQAAFFGITERFQDSLFLLAFIFGWPPMIDSLHLNQAPGSDRMAELGPKTISLIRNRVNLDAKLYRFGQKIFEQRFNTMLKLLLQRYGNTTHQKLKPPFPVDVMVELLQKHYEARRNHRNQAFVKNIRSPYFYSLSSYSEGAFGWYPLDTSTVHGPMRWSGPGLQSGFDLPLPSGKNIQISFRILMVLQPDIIDRLSLTANNVLVTLRHNTDSDGAFIFTGEIPPHAIAGPFLRLVFSVPRTIAPCSVDPSNKDSRLLGILLNWVKLQANDL